jgi:hypothetical protein
LIYRQFIQFYFLAGILLLESRGGCDDFVMIIMMPNFPEGDFDLKRAISVVRLFGQNFSIQIAKIAFSD